MEALEHTIVEPKGSARPDEMESGKSHKKGTMVLRPLFSKLLFSSSEALPPSFLNSRRECGLDSAYVIPRVGVILDVLDSLFDNRIYCNNYSQKLISYMVLI